MSSDWGFGDLEQEQEQEQFDEADDRLWPPFAPWQGTNIWPNILNDNDPPQEPTSSSVDLTASSPPPPHVNTASLSRSHDFGLPGQTLLRQPPTHRDPRPQHRATYLSTILQAEPTTDESLTPSSPDMLPTNASQRRAPRVRPTATSTIDLTRSPPPRQSTKRPAPSSTSNQTSHKRRRLSGASPALASRVEELEDEAPGAEDEIAQAAQLSALAQQARDEGPVRIGMKNCIICLENFTNATTSACGHIFCHECLTRALIASEKSSSREGVGNCPACRTKLKRKTAGQVVAISFMKKSAFLTKGRGRELA
ncbi:sensitivity to high expression protein she9 [Oleoguttula sp. CCFEE 5521]